MHIDQTNIYYLLVFERNGNLRRIVLAMNSLTQRLSVLEEMEIPQNVNINIEPQIDSQTLDQMIRNGNQ